VKYSNTNAVVPLTLVAAEVGMTADELASRFGDAVTEDDAGLRGVTTETAVHRARRAAQRAERERRAAERVEARRRPNPIRERVRAIAAAQEKFVGGHDMPALARVLGDSHDDRPLDEMLQPPGAPLTYHPIRQTKGV
jgi:hypothetical protein